MNLTVQAPFVLLLLPLVFLPLLARTKGAIPLSTLDPFRRLSPTLAERLHRLSPWLASATLLVLLLSLCRPALLDRSRETVREGADVMLVLDISASMGAADIAPDRMSVARSTAADFLRSRSDDRVGALLFSGVPYLLSPPTIDREHVVRRLMEVRADRSGSGTAMGDALAAATARLKDSEAKSRVIVLLTDGTSNRGRVTTLAAARAAAALGVRIYSIGFGTLEGGEVHLPGATASSAGKTPRDALEEEPLRQIARLTNGRYFRAGSAHALEEVYRQIDRLEKSPLEVRERVEERSLAPLFARLAALLLALDLLLFGVAMRRVP